MTRPAGARKKLLVTGASGYIGGRLLEALSASWEASGTCFAHPKAGLRAADLADPARARELLESLRPDVVINCAAMASPGDCERDPAGARRANVDLARSLAGACARAGARLLHLSTDLVFDGKRGWYAEDDETSPQNAYGRTKLEGERAVLEACPGAAVVRVALVYGRALGGRPSFLDWLLDELSAGRRPKLFTDQWRTPGAVAQLPAVLSRLAETGARGIFHWGGAERVNRLAFGQAVCRVYGLDASRLEGARVQDVGFNAAGPGDCSLRSDKLAALVGLRPWTLQQGLDAERTRASV